MLFYLGTNPYFPEGTLFDLKDSEPLLIPDRGDGETAAIDRDHAIKCPPFAENVPPGQCPAVVTSFKIDDRAEDIAAIQLDESIHFQVLVIPQPVESILVNDRTLSVEVDSYFPSGDDADTNFRLHISHLRPGFYEAVIRFADCSAGRLTFVKFFPSRFSAGYNGLEKNAAASNSDDMIADEGAKAGPESELFNKALELATEWGENFRKPINDRIRIFYPDLTGEQIDRLAKLVGEAESYIYRLAERELAGEITEGDIVPEARRKFSWLDDDNAYRLRNIGMYYARK